MKILALDTSSTSASVALCDGERILGEYYLNASLTHSQTILPMVKDLLLRTRVPLSEIDRLAVAVGPGSFTGLRIGIASVKGMAEALDIPTAGISTLEGLAYNLIGLPGLALPVMDARNEECYAALFESGKNNLTRITEDLAVCFKELYNRIKEFSQPITLLGDGALPFYERFHSDLPSLQLAPPALIGQRASSFCRAALTAPPLTAAQLVPVYIRIPQAERELHNRQKQEELRG